MPSTDRIYIGFAPLAGVTETTVFHADEGELRKQAHYGSGAVALVVSRQGGSIWPKGQNLEDDLEERLAAVSAAVSVSRSDSHEYAREEVNRATEAADWTPVHLKIDGVEVPAKLFQLSSGEWAGFARLGGGLVAVGAHGLDVADLDLITLRPEDVQSD